MTDELTIEEHRHKRAMYLMELAENVATRHGTAALYLLARITATLDDLARDAIEIAIGADDWTGPIDD